MRFLYLFATTVRVTASCPSFFFFLFFLSFFIFQPAFPSSFPSFCLFCLLLPLLLSAFLLYNFLCLLPSFFFFLLPYNFRTAYPSVWISYERCRVEAMRRQFNSRCSFAYLYFRFVHVRTHYYSNKHTARNFKIRLRLRTMHHIQTQQDVSATGSVSFVRLDNVSLKTQFRPLPRAVAVPGQQKSDISSLR